MTPWAENLGRWLIDYYLLATVLLTGILLVGMWLRQPARWINLSWAATTGLLGLAVITAAQAFMPLAPPVLTVPVFASVLQKPNPPARITDVEVDSVMPPSENVIPPEVSPSPFATEHWSARISVRSTLAYLFLLAATIILGWQILGAILTIRLRRDARPAHTSVQLALRQVWTAGDRTPRVLVSSSINQALAMGVLKPVILLPEWFESRESQDSVHAVLAHEASHIFNRDLWLRALQRVLMWVLFAHPLVWWLRSATHANQEYLADASARGEEPLDYAEILLHWFRTGAASRNQMLTATVGLWESPHLLKRRISMVLNEDLRIERTCPTRWGYGVWSVVSMCVLALSCITLHTPSVAEAQDAKQKESNEKEASQKETPRKGKAKPKKKGAAKPTVESIEVVKKPLSDDDQLKFTDDQIAKAKAKYASADEAFGVGAAHYNSRNFAASREPFEAAAILGADVEYRVKVYGALMASYRLLGTVEPFVAVCEYIIRHSERDAEQSLTRRSLLSFLHERGKIDPFIQRHEERLKKAPQDRLSVYLLSEVYSRLRENPARSIELLKQLALLDGKQSGDVVDIRVTAQLAMQHIRAKEYQQGAELYEKIAPLDKSMAAWHWKEAATAWLKLKQNDKALAAAKKSAESDPEKRSDLLTHFWHRHLGDVFLATGEAKLAIPQFEQAIETTKIEGYVKDCRASLAEAKMKAGE